MKLLYLFNCLFTYVLATQWYDNNTYRLPQREAVAVGYSREIKLTLDRTTHTLKTLSVNPPIFEVKNFLTSEECEYLIFLAKNEGLKDSPTKPETKNFKTNKKVFAEWDVNNSSYIEPNEFTFLKGNGDLYLTEYEIMRMLDDLKIDKNHDNKMDYKEFRTITGERIQKYFINLFYSQAHLRSRLSKQAWLWHYGVYDDLLEGFHERLARLTLLPHDLIEMSEPMQVVRYEEGGHYHCHHDSDDVDPSIPCCTYNNQNDINCRQCRFMTIMFFLNNVTYGGETAFPVADNKTFTYEDWEIESVNKCNLADNCDNSNLIVQPLKETALMWYNHEVSETNGWLGKLDPVTYHGGCDVTNNEKWIANTWINVIGEKGSRDSYDGWLRMRMDKVKAEL